jgi:hypothetical protein
MLRKRKIEREFATLYRELLDDENSFCKYFRTSIQQFNISLSKVQRGLTKRNTTFRKAVTAKEKLAVCLRLVSTLLLEKRNINLLVVTIKTEEKRL